MFGAKERLNDKMLYINPLDGSWKHRDRIEGWRDLVIIPPSARGLPLVRPELAATIALSAETLDRIWLDLPWLPTRVVVESELRHRRNISQRKECQVVEAVVSVVPRHWDHLAVGIAGMVHETRRRTHFLAIDDINVVVIHKEIEREQVRQAAFGPVRFLALVGCLLGDDLSQVAVDELPCPDWVWRTKSCGRLR